MASRIEGFMFTSLIPLKVRLPLNKNNARNIKEKITKALIKYVIFLSFDLLAVISDNPRIATKGNDQIRFELGSYALNPDIKVLAPWRTWEYSSRADLINYCDKHQINIEVNDEDPTYSVDENLLHTSYEGGVLEDPSKPAPEEIWQRTNSISAAPEEGENIQIDFLQGDPISVNNQQMCRQIYEHINKQPYIHKYIST